MVSHGCIMILVIATLLAGGCSRAVSPWASEQEKFFAHVKAADPGEDQALKYVKYYRLTGRHDLAVAALTEALRQDPQNVRLLNALGTLYDQLGDYRQAQASYQKILALDPDNALALNNLGYSHYLAGDLLAAEKTLKALVAKHPDNTIARNNLGLVWCRQGRAPDAVDLWEKQDGPALAQVKLQQVLAFLGQGHNAATAGSADIQVAEAPQPGTPAPPVHLQEKSTAAATPEQTAAGKAPSPPHVLAAPLVAQKHVPESGAVTTRPAAPGDPRVRVEEVAMIIQPASYTPEAAGASPAPLLPGPAAAMASDPKATVAPSRPSAGEQLRRTDSVAPQDNKPRHRPPRYRLITVPPLALPQTVQPLREYIVRPYSHQGLHSPATPDLAVY
ncbi:MAG: tetratricopeptide repeat protein [Desulfobacca sp.]|uniref:tetratricopeptide repeat protein n=1 Tax=Desulfobacca sp. TaxID=2067990 RepID=UPI00404B91B4